MKKNAIIALLAVVGSSTAALAAPVVRDHRAQPAPTVVVNRPTTNVRPVVQAPRPVFTRPVVTRPVITPVVQAPRPVAQNDRDWNRGGRDNDHRGHGPVVHQPPVIVRPIIERPIYTRPVYTQPVYQPVVYTPPAPSYDNCDATGAYIGSVGTVPNSWSNGWIDLTSAMSLSRGHQLIDLGAQVGPIDNLMLKELNGATLVTAVQVNFVDGNVQTFTTRETIDAQNTELTLNLGHRAVDSIMVFGQSAPYANYQILAR